MLEKCIEFIDRNDSDSLDSLLKESKDLSFVNTTNQFGFAPIHTAACVGNTRAILSLLKIKADINIRQSKSQATALILAIHHKKEEAVRLLLLNGANTQLTNCQNRKAADFLPKDKDHPLCKIFFAFQAASDQKSLIQILLKLNNVYGVAKNEVPSLKKIAGLVVKFNRIMIKNNAVPEDILSYLQEELPSNLLECQFNNPLENLDKLDKLISDSNDIQEQMLVCDTREKIQKIHRNPRLRDDEKSSQIKKLFDSIIEKLNVLKLNFL